MSNAFAAQCHGHRRLQCRHISKQSLSRTSKKEASNILIVRKNNDIGPF